MSLKPEEQQRISEEEETLEQVARSLEQQISYSSSRLRTESARAQDLTQRIVAARRDSDKQMLASDEAVSHQLRDAKRDEVKQLDRLIEKPYFARIVLEEEEPNGKTREIEYKLGVAANTDCRIIDWRKAPIARLYYEYQEGEEYEEEILGRERIGVVRVRNKVDIGEGKLRRLSCGLGMFQQLDGKWQKTTNARPSFDGRSRGLPNVLQLITAEQFRTITEDADSAVLIQGIAGSGKTTVALYRLAWLLHEDNSSVGAEDALIIVFSKTLKRYIIDSLPSLNIHNLEVLTFSEWAALTIKKVLAPTANQSFRLRRPNRPAHPSARRVKKSMAMLLRLEEYAEELRAQLVRDLREGLNWQTLPRQVGTTFQVQSERKNPVLTLISDLEQSLKQNSTQPILSQQDADKKNHALEFLAAQRKKMRDYLGHIQRILSQPDKLLTWDETNLLDAETIELTRHTAEWQFKEGILDYADDALVLRLCQLIGDGLYRPDGARGLLEHIVADEVQDFGASELAALINAVEEVSQLTLVGDSVQEMGESQSFPGWEKLRSHWSLGDELSQFHSLTVSHRSTLPIMRLADHVAGVDRTTDGRPGKPPIWFNCRTENRGVREAIDWLQRVHDKFPGSLTAVLCRSSSEAAHVHSLLEPSFGYAVRLGDDDSFSFEEGIVVTDIRQVKGLEFPHVMLWNPSAKKYPPSQGARNALYVGITRAEEHLCIVTWGNHTRLLPSIHSKLIRGYEYEVEEEGD